MANKLLGVLCGAIACAVLGFATSIVFYFDTWLWDLLAYLLVVVYAGLGVVTSGILAVIDDKSQSYPKLLGFGVASAAAVYCTATVVEHFVNGTPFAKQYDDPVNLITVLVLLGLTSASGYYFGSRKIGEQSAG